MDIEEAFGSPITLHHHQLFGMGGMVRNEKGSEWIGQAVLPTRSMASGEVVDKVDKAEAAAAALPFGYATMLKELDKVEWQEARAAALEAEEAEEAERLKRRSTRKK